MKSPPDFQRAEGAFAAFLEALGYDLDSPELIGTPARVVEAYVNDLLTGERIDVDRLIADGSIHSDSSSLVVVHDIATMTVCPHHVLPAQGQATVAYLPGDRILGLGAVARLVDAYARRLTLQEEIARCVTAALMRQLGAKGAFCSLRFQHACLRLRGPRQSAGVVQSVHAEGALVDGPYARQLGLTLGAQRVPTQHDGSGCP